MFVRAVLGKLFPMACGLSRWLHICHKGTDESACRRKQLLVAPSQSVHTFDEFHSLPLKRKQLVPGLD